MKSSRTIIWALFLVMLPFFGFSQSDPVDTARYDGGFMDSVPGATASILQSRARIFVAREFNSYKDAMQLDDTITHSMAVRGRIIPVIHTAMYGNVEYGHVDFLLEMRFMDGQYKVSLSEFTHRATKMGEYSGGSMENRKPACSTWNLTLSNWRKIKKSTNAQIAFFLIDLKITMIQG